MKDFKPDLKGHMFFRFVQLERFERWMQVVANFPIFHQTKLVTFINQNYDA